MLPAQVNGSWDKEWIYFHATLAIVAIGVCFPTGTIVVGCNLFSLVALNLAAVVMKERLKEHSARFINAIDIAYPFQFIAACIYAYLTKDQFIHGHEESIMYEMVVSVLPHAVIIMFHYSRMFATFEYILRYVIAVDSETPMEHRVARCSAVFAFFILLNLLFINWLKMY